MRITAMLLCVSLVGVCGCRTPEQEGVDHIAELIESIEFELPVELEQTCVLPPEGTSPFVAKFVIENAPPLRPTAPDFPFDNAPPNAVLFSTASGEGMGTYLGRFAFSEGYYGIPGFRIVGDIEFRAQNGDELHATELSQAGPTIPPPFPNATFTGQFTFAGGTGRFDGARGTASVSAQQLGGEPLPGMPPNIPGSTAVVLCGWIDLEGDESGRDD